MSPVARKLPNAIQTNAPSTSSTSRHHQPAVQQASITDDDLLLAIIVKVVKSGPRGLKLRDVSNSFSVTDNRVRSLVGRYNKDNKALLTIDAQNFVTSPLKVSSS